MGIQFWHGLQKGPVLDTFNQIVHEWNAGHQDAQVEVKAYDNDYAAAVKDGLAQEEGSRPDLVLAPEFMSATMWKAFSERKAIPIQDYINEENLAEVAELVRRTFGDAKGKLVSLPFNPACGVIYTNKDLLRKVNRDPDYVPKTLEELEEVCRELISAGHVTAGHTSAWVAAYKFEAPAAQQNQPVVLPDNGRLGYGQYQLSGGFFKEHFCDLARQSKEKLYLYAGNSNDAYKPFVNREVAFYMQGSTHYQFIAEQASKSQEPFEVGVGPLPILTRGATEKHAFPLGGASIWALNNGEVDKKVEQVRQFLNHLASTEVQKFWHCGTGYVPVTDKFVATLDEFYKTHPAHKAVVENLQAKVGDYSFGIHAPNYAALRSEELIELIESIVNNPEITDEQIVALLKEFDEKHSTEPPKQ